MRSLPSIAIALAAGSDKVLGYRKRHDVLLHHGTTC
jgi:hypothetical protein